MNDNDTTAAKQTNCPNCGAPLNKLGDCEYCGTSVIKPLTSKSEIVITKDYIHISCG